MILCGCGYDYVPNIVTTVIVLWNLDHYFQICLLLISSQSTKSNNKINFRHDYQIYGQPQNFKNTVVKQSRTTICKQFLINLKVIKYKYLDMKL